MVTKLQRQEVYSSYRTYIGKNSKELFCRATPNVLHTTKRDAHKPAHPRRPSKCRGVRRTKGTVTRNACACVRRSTQPFALVLPFAENLRLASGGKCLHLCIGNPSFMVCIEVNATAACSKPCVIGFPSFSVAVRRCRSQFWPCIAQTGAVRALSSRNTYPCF